MDYSGYFQSSLVQRVIRHFSFLVLFCSPFLTHAQGDPYNFFREITLAIDTTTYSTNYSMISVKGEPRLSFEYEDDQAYAEVKLFPTGILPIEAINLKTSEDFKLIDSIENINGNYYRFKVQFRKLTLSKFLQFTFRIASENLESDYIYQLKLFPITKTSAFIKPNDNKLFIGEERKFIVETNRPDNLVIEKQWTRNKNIDYRFSKNKGQVRLHVLPNRSGTQKINIPLKVKKPSLNYFRQPVYELKPIIYSFEVKQRKLIFLTTSLNDVTLKPANRQEGVEIELDYHPDLEMKKTYRLEKQEKAGGVLIAEIFTKNVLSNGRILSSLRVYNEHRQSEGYLYIKDGDAAKFITNFSITPNTSISSVEVVSIKGNQSKGKTLYPGEKVLIRVTGQGLHKSSLNFSGLVDVQPDTIVQTEQELQFKALVPINIGQSKVDLLNDGTKTGQSLKVSEYHIPHPMDFISIEINDEFVYKATEIDKTIFTDGTIEEVVIVFDPDAIDLANRLYGKQNISIEIQVTGKSNNLIDQRKIENMTICPGMTSPRFDFYDQKDCRFENISLNQYLRQKTSDLEPWGRIRLVIKHDSKHYSRKGFERRIEIIPRQYTSFDLDVSFPAGLLTKRFGEEGFGTLSGVSMAIIAQFSFYHPKRIARLRPYKFGVGFLALNAFNFSENSQNRDVGIVALASLYPIKSKDRNRLSFPLFFGGGYFLSESKFFYLLGPGIRLRL